MNFGQAIEAMKVGKFVARMGWNGRGVYLYLQTWKPWNEGHDPVYQPCVVMFTTQGTFQPGWLASQADILAEDWEVVG